MKNQTSSINEIYPIKSLGVTGRGVCIAILDTGIYPHADLASRIISFKDFVNHKENAYDDNSHGTHVAGIAAGDGSACRQAITGVAVNSRILALKILDKKGNGDKQSLINACNWLITNMRRYSIKIVNISVGAETTDCNEEKTEIAQLIDLMWSLGLVVVVSAGNSGPGPGTITFPGTCENVITVGSDTAIIKHSSHSGEGPTKCNIQKPDILAPGNNIISCHNKYNGYTTKSGTSMSTPAVSGAIALYLEKYQGASNADVKRCLLKSASDLGLSKNRQGAGLLNIKRFLETEP